MTAGDRSAICERRTDERQCHGKLLSPKKRGFLKALIRFAGYRGLVLEDSGHLTGRGSGGHLEDELTDPHFGAEFNRWTPLVGDLQRYLPPETSVDCWRCHVDSEPESCQAAPALHSCCQRRWDRQLTP